MQFLRFALTLIAVFLFTGLRWLCIAHPDAVLHTSFAKRYRYVDSLRILVIKNNDHPVKAAAMLNDWIKQAQEQGDEALTYQLKVSSIYTNLPDNHTELEQQVLNDIQGAKKDGYVLEAADGYHILSEWVYNNGNRAKGIEYALLCYDLCKNIPLSDFPPKAKNSYRLAIWYYLYKEYRKTINYLLELGRTDEGSLYADDGKFLNTLALAYRGRGQYDSAVYYFNIIFQDKEGLINNDNTKAIVAGNIGGTYLLDGNYTEAIKWVKRELELSRQGKNMDNASVLNAYVLCADIYMKMGQQANASLYMDSAKQVRPHIRNIIRLHKYYDVCIEVLRANALYRQALIYTDSLLAVRDSSDASSNLSQVSEAEKHIARLKYQSEMETVRHERQKSVWLRNFLIVFILFTSVLALLLINRSRLKHKQKQLELERENAMAAAKLSAYTTTLHEKNLQLAQMKEELEELSTEEDIAVKNELIRQLQQSTILTDEQWDDFRDIFEQVHSGYIARIKERFPGLTPAELRYITLVKLRLTTKEMANILGVNSSTVRNYKSRMKKKFSISDDVDFEDLLRQV